MADYRQRVQQVESSHTQPELVDVLSQMLGQRVTSVNPLTEAMFDRIAADSTPLKYAKKDTNYAADLKPVAKNATGLKHLLHEQIGRPLHQRVGRLTTRDFAECIVALEAFEAGVERAPGAHVSLTLPLDVEEYAETPDRWSPTESPYETILEIKSLSREELVTRLANLPGFTNAPYTVYVLDCTPPVGDDEPTRIRSLREEVQTSIESGRSLSIVSEREAAAHVLNHDGRIFYVGSTNNLPKRIHEHSVGTAMSGVNFTNTFQPRRLVFVEGCQSRREAEALEGELARKLDDTDGLFAYSDML